MQSSVRSLRQACRRTARPHECRSALEHTPSTHSPRRKHATSGARGGRQIVRQRQQSRPTRGKASRHWKRLRWFGGEIAKIAQDFDLRRLFKEIASLMTAKAIQPVRIGSIQQAFFPCRIDLSFGLDRVEHRFQMVFSRFNRLFALSNPKLAFCTMIFFGP